MSARIKNICPACGELMQVREHAKGIPEILGHDHVKTQPYYFTEWYYCPECRYIQHFEKNKVYTGR